MSSQSLLLAGGAIVAAGIGAFLYFSGGADSASGDDGSTTIDRSETVDRPVGPATEEKLSSLTNETGAREEASSDLTPTTTLVPGAASSNLDPDALRIIQVEIQAPLGAPPDPDLQVVAWSDEELAEDEIDWSQERVRRRFQRRASAAEALRSFELAESADEVRWSVTEAGDQRIVEVAFDRAAKLGRIQLAGRYLYLAEPTEVDLSGDVDRVVVTPEVGTWIVGRVRTLGADVAPGENGSFGAVTLSGGTMGGGRARGGGMGFTERRFELADESLTFEFRGVRPDLQVRVSADIPSLAPGRSDTLELAAGTKVTADVSVARGGAVEGRVVDLGGDSVEGALIKANKSGGMWGRGNRASREATSDSEGKFRVVGLGAGTYRIDASLEGWRNGRADGEFEVEAASTRTGVLVELDPGFVIRGKVVLPGGAAAGGAKLRLEQAGAAAPARQANPWGRRGDSKERKDTVTAADGTFAFMALTESPARIAAALEVVSQSGEVEPLAAIVEDVGPKEYAKAEAIEITLAPTVTVRGRVLDDAGAPVTAFEVRAARDGYNSRSGAGDGARADFESEDGTFELAGVSDGTWRISVQAEDHSSPEDQTQTVVVPQSEAPLTFTLVRLAAIRGLVVDPSGLPVEGARVTRARDTGGMGGFGGFNRDRGVETDAAGAFELKGLTPGTQRIEAKSDSWAPTLPLTVEAVAGVDSEGVVLQLRRGGTISGVVRDDSGAPWSGRRVAYAQGGGPMAMFAGEGTATTDASGQFTFEHVAPGKWSVTASPSNREMMETMQGARDQNAFFELMGKNLTTEVVVADEEEVFVELGAEPVQPVIVFGTVTRAGSPVTTGAVTFAREGGDLFANLLRGNIEGDGTYRLELKRPGAYIVSLERGSMRNQFFVDVAAPPEEGGEQKVDLAVPEGGIAGRVRTPEGDPAAGQRVTVEAKTSFAFSRFDPRSATTDDKGEFQLLDLDPGTYTLRVGQSGLGFRGRSSGTFGRAVVNDITVTAESVTGGIDVRLAGSGRVTGEVVDAEGAPVSGATIFVRDATGRPIDSISTVRTGASGRFTYDRVAPGSYVVSARTGEGAAPDEAGVVVTEGEDTKVELKVESATTLIIRTLEEDDTAVRAELSVVDSEGREMTGLVGTELFRSFGTGISTTEQRVGPLPPGRYTVSATAQDGRTTKKRVTVRTRAESRVKLEFKKPAGD